MLDHFVLEKMTVLPRIRLPPAISALLLLLPTLTSLFTLVVAQSSSSSPTCGFCPGGSPPLHPSALLDAANDNATTCGDAHNLLLTGVSPGDDCTAAQIETVLELEGGYPDHCGYCPVTGGDGDDGAVSTCTLCPTGELPTLPASTPVTLPDGTSTTCGALHYLSQLERIYSTTCLEYQSLSAQCGCRPTECSACPSGQELVNPDKWSFAAEMQCGDVARNAPSLDATGDDCRTVQTIAMGECGCAYVPPYAPECSLCADGSAVPNPTYQLFPGDELSSCGLYSWYASLPPFNSNAGEGEEQCQAAQATFGAACGCADPPRPQCRIQCRGYLDDETGLYQEIIFNATHVLQDFEIGDADYLFEGQHVCGEVLFEMSVQSEICTKESRAALEEACCRMPYVAPEGDTSAAGGGYGRNGRSWSWANAAPMVAGLAVMVLV